MSALHFQLLCLLLTFYIVQSWQLMCCVRRKRQALSSRLMAVMPPTSRRQARRTLLHQFFLFLSYPPLVSCEEIIEPLECQDGAIVYGKKNHLFTWCLAFPPLAHSCSFIRKRRTRGLSASMYELTTAKHNPKGAHKSGLCILISPISVSLVSTFSPRVKEYPCCKAMSVPEELEWLYGTRVYY